ncbi:MAG: hypothetical protein DI565_12440 [Ancylobacter novellus]|uniref:PilZ domain-containing protein n=1 Tax=Ancylobacter novellus TaxID=921 RepID=A0A2W5M9Y7_ANCNO|nr:MAG: hypothetical protein DI565_12440 [Ancylobacter novellus]
MDGATNGTFRPVDVAEGLAAALVSEDDDGGLYEIPGRCMLADGEEFPSRAIKISTTHAAIVGGRRVEAGEIVVCYLDNVGILRGLVSRPLKDGFILALDVAATRKETVEEALKWHAARAAAVAELRAAPRIVPLNRLVEVRLGENLVFRGVILNVSIGGAAIAMKPDERPFRGALVRTGSRYATVVRLLDNGVAVQFMHPLERDGFDQTVVL